MSRENLDRWCELGILALVLVILVGGPLGGALVRGGFQTEEFLVPQALTCGVLLLWGARLWLSPRPKLLWPPICWAVAAFTLYAIARYLTADIEYVARQELLRVLVYAVLFFAILNNLHSQEAVQVITFTLIFLAMAISLYAVFQFLTDSPWVGRYRRTYEHRASGTYVSPNHLGGFLELILPLGLAYTLAGRFKPLTKVLLGYAALAIVAGIVVTLSRGTWVSTALSLMLFFGVLASNRAYRAPVLGLLALAVVAGFVFIPQSYFFQMRLNQLFEEARGAGTVGGVTRLALWRPAIEIWKENPWWGVGPAHFDYRFRAHRPEDVQLRPERVHNDYLNTLADWGVVGTGLVASAWVLLGAGVRKTWPFVRRARSDLGGKRGGTKLAFVLGSATGLLAILFHSVLDFNMHVPANAILVVALMAMLSSCVRFATDQCWVGTGLRARLFLTAVFLGGLAYLGYQGWRLGAEAVWLERSGYAPLAREGRESELPLEQASFLTNAYAVEPMNPATSYAIGEALRGQSFAGGVYSREFAMGAMEWFGRTIKLNPWNGYGFLRYGMCLDWLDRQAESGPYFDRADELDPNGYLAAANIGLHYVRMGDLAAAKMCFERSLRLQVNDNSVARSYLQLVNQRMLEAATNETSARLGLWPQ